MVRNELSPNPDKLEILNTKQIQVIQSGSCRRLKQEPYLFVLIILFWTFEYCLEFLFCQKKHENKNYY